MRAITRVSLLMPLFGAALVGCVDREFITVHDKPAGRPVGGACTVDAECDSGRCVAGVCHDGGCSSDGDCRQDEICVFESCEPTSTFECQPDQAPILSIAPSLSIDFGQVNLGQTLDETVTVQNVGDCLLTLSSSGLSDTSNPGFTCEPCDPATYPQRIPPQQALDITVHYAPVATGDASGQLLIRSDDATAGDEGLVAVDLHADYDGIPSLVVEPSELNFGFVPFVAGGQQGQADETVEITNRGTGNAALVIERMFVDENLEFFIDPSFDDVSPDSPLVVPPYDPNDPSTVVTVDVTFRPDRNADFDDRLVIRDDQNHTVPVNLTGSSLGPPEINVSATELDYKCGVGVQNDVCPTNEAYPVGTVAFRQLTISNSGQSALNVNMTLGGEASDFTVSPTFIPPIPAGGSIPITVFFAPSAPSNPANRFDPIDPFDAVLNITSNDTDPSTDVLKTVVLKGFSKGGQNDQVLKLEMNYENADNSWAGNDFRDVDLELESPTGFTCAKPHIPFVSDGNGGFVPDLAHETDYCQQWNDFGQEGETSWIALGQYEEPERILLFGLGPTAAEGGTFTARAYYIEDCANIPTGLLADLLGIGGSILLGVLGGAVGVPIAVPPDQISDLVANNCFDHSSSLVTLHISLDGTEVAAPQQRLQHKGDVLELAHLQRRNGQFCDPAVGIPCP